MPTKHEGTPDEIRALNTYIKFQRSSETALARTTAHLKAYNLTSSQFAILEALYHLGTLSQRALATKMLRSPSNMSIVLKTIEKRGLVARVRNPDDNRYVQVSITQNGHELIASLLDEHIAGIVAELGVLTAEEQEELARLCRKLGLREDANESDLE